MMQSDFSELILNDLIGNAPTRWDFSELILNDSSLLLGTREYLGNRWSDWAEIWTVGIFLIYIATLRVRSKL